MLIEMASKTFVYYYVPVALLSLLISTVESQGLLPDCYFRRDKDYICTDSCTKIVRCVPSGPNTADYVEQVVRTCPLKVGSLCNPDSLDCTADTCNDGDYFSEPIECAEEGIFPDPWDCKWYLVCNGTSRAYQEHCPIDTAFDVRVKNCTEEATSARPCINYNFPIKEGKCDSVEDAAAYPEDPTIFYVCAYNSYGYLLPKFSTCKNGYFFDNNKKQCVSSSDAMQVGPSYVALYLSIASGLALRSNF